MWAVGAFLIACGLLAILFFGDRDSNAMPWIVALAIGLVLVIGAGIDMAIR